MDRLDRALYRAFAQARANLTRTQRGRDQLARRNAMAGRPVQARPLRSWALCLRAADSRLSPQRRPSQISNFKSEIPIPRRLTAIDHTQCPWLHPDRAQTLEILTLTGPALRQLCGPVTIPWPGLPLPQAAKLLGVNLQTLRQWTRNQNQSSRGHGKPPKLITERWGPSQLFFEQFPQKPRRPRRSRLRETHQPPTVTLSHTPARHHDRRCKTVVWTPAPIFPHAQPWSPPWGDIPKLLADRLPDDFTQTLERTWQETAVRNHDPDATGAMGAIGAILYHWRCPDCARWCRMLFLPMPVWTLPASRADGTAAALARAPLLDHFTCRRCANLQYESAERRKKGDKMRNAPRDRFIKRISGGILTAKDVTL